MVITLEPIAFTANSSKNVQRHCQLTNCSSFCKSPLHNHTEDPFQTPQFFHSASWFHTEKILNRDKSQNNLLKNRKKLLQR